MIEDTATHRRWLETAVAQFAGRIEDADLDHPVPACPDWDVAGLVDHVVGVHTWARDIMSTGGPPQRSDDPTAPTRTAESYAQWYAAEALAMQLEMDRHDPAEPCWNFSTVNTTYAFWPRRQAHEITVHTVDAAAAAGVDLPIDAAIAADGIDEVLRVFGVRMAARGFTADLAAPLSIAPRDTDRSWTVHPPIDGAAAVVTDGADTTAASALTGSSSDVLLVLWKRLPHDRLTIEGDPAVASPYLDSRLTP